MSTTNWFAAPYGITGREQYQNVKNIVQIFRELSIARYIVPEAIAGIVGCMMVMSGINPWSWSPNTLASTDTTNLASTNYEYGLLGYSPPNVYINRPTVITNPLYGPHFSDIVGVSSDGDPQTEFSFSGVGYVGDPITPTITDYLITRQYNDGKPEARRKGLVYASHNYATKMPFYLDPQQNPNWASFENDIADWSGYWYDYIVKMWSKKGMPVWMMCKYIKP